jgi:hypothetical protein
MSRSRAVAFEDKSGTPGDVTTRYAAGIVAIPAATIDLSFDLQTSNFTNGRTVTGATSGATGVIASQTDAGATGTLRLTSVTGNFIDDEIITDTMTGSATVNGYGRATVKITTPFASVGDMVHVTPLGLDDTLNGISASVSADAVITVQGRGVATVTYPLSFEIIKKGSFAYDL